MQTQFLLFLALVFLVNQDMTFGRICPTGRQSYLGKYAETEKGRCFRIKKYDMSKTKLENVCTSCSEIRVQIPKRYRAVGVTDAIRGLRKLVKLEGKQFRFIDWFQPFRQERHYRKCLSRAQRVEEYETYRKDRHCPRYLPVVCYRKTRSTCGGSSSSESDEVQESTTTTTSITPSLLTCAPSDNIIDCDQEDQEVEVTSAGGFFSIQMQKSPTESTFSCFFKAVLPKDYYLYLPKSEQVSIEDVPTKISEIAGIYDLNVNLGNQEAIFPMPKYSFIYSLATSFLNISIPGESYSHDSLCVRFQMQAITPPKSDGNTLHCAEDNTERVNFVNYTDGATLATPFYPLNFYGGSYCKLSLQVPSGKLLQFEVLNWIIPEAIQDAFTFFIFGGANNLFEVESQEDFGDDNKITVTPNKNRNNEVWFAFETDFNLHGGTEPRRIELKVTMIDANQQ